MKTLEEYFKDDYDRNVIDHTLRVSLDSEGHPTFYIHPMGVNGETLDFKVIGNELIPLR